MTMCANEPVVGCDERYWADGKAAVPVLLLDEATEAITEAVHRMRRGSVLEQRDVAATGVALGDLFGGLSQLVELCTTLMDQMPELNHCVSDGSRTGGRRCAS
jgi:hypothetical protein